MMAPGRRDGLPHECWEQGMKVLMIEPTQGAGSGPEAAALAAAGHDVVTCTDDTGRLECNGMPGGSGCPVDGSGVDVAVAIGSEGEMPVHADGVRCAVRHFVPLVTTGGPADNDPADNGPADNDVQSAGGGSASRLFGGAVPVVHADGPDDLAMAVVAAAGSTLDHHCELATAELRTVLAHNGIEAPDARVMVHRLGGTLRVELFPSVPVSKQLAQAAAVRVAAALRAYDTTTRGVGVVLAGGS